MGVADRPSKGVPPETTYSADSQLRHPRQFLRASWRHLAASRTLARRLMLRDLRSQYRGSGLGYLWLFGPAVAMAGVWMLLNAGKILNPGDVGMPYAVYALIGTLLWQAFSDAVSAPVQQLTSSAHMLSRVNFPAESLLLAALGRVLLNAAARFVVLVPVMVLARVSPGWGLVFVPVGVVGIVLAGYSVGLVLAPFGALYRDVGQALPLALSFLVLVTPVAYVPPKRGLIAHLVQLNPIAPPLQVTRGWLTGGAVAPTSSWWVVSVASVAVLAAGWSLFRLAIPHLVDRISQ